MKLLKLLAALPIMGLLTTCTAQVKNARTVTVHVNGDCDMCKKTIEGAALEKGVAQAEWDTDAKLATITYDSMRTNVDAVLKRIALAGYDNQNYLAPDAAYSKLPGCCQYERTTKHKAVNDPASTTQHRTEGVQDQQAMAGHDMPMPDPAQQPNVKSDDLNPVFDSYFELKDALVASDEKMSATKASALMNAVKSVKMEQLPAEVHVVWMKVMDPIAKLAMGISTTKDIDKQRTAFSTLSGHMHDLVKVAPRPMPVYYDHCPMYNGGADWLSQEKPIKNPFYGSMMLSCGSVQETIK